jgi:hypothetical protein
MKLVPLRLPLQQMHQSKTFVLSLRESTLGCAVQKSTLLIVEVATKTSCLYITKQKVWIMPTVSTTLGRHASATRQMPG